MTEAEKLRADCKLIATHIHGWAEYTCDNGISGELHDGHITVTCVSDVQVYGIVDNGQLKIQWDVSEFKPYENTPQGAAQSLAVRRKLNEDFRFQIEITIWTVTHCRLFRPSIHDESHYIHASDKDELMACFKAYVKVANWIRDQKDEVKDD